MYSESYPSTVWDNLAISTDGSLLPTPDKSPRDIQYFNVLKLMPTAKRKAHALIIQLTPEVNDPYAASYIWPETLQELCQAHSLIASGENVEVYYLEKEASLENPFPSRRLMTPEASAWSWTDAKNSLTLGRLADAVNVPTYLLAEMLSVFG